MLAGGQKRLNQFLNLFIKNLLPFFTDRRNLKKDMKNEIKVFFKGDVKDEETTLVKYSHDASLLEVRPKVVVFPKDADDVKNLVKWVGENKDKYQDQERNKNWANLSITARCAGTD